MNYKQRRRSVVAFSLIFVMFALIAFFGATSIAKAGYAPKEVYYVSFGDSMTNGYGLAGYDLDNGESRNGFLQNDVTESYAALLSDYLQGHKDEFFGSEMGDVVWIPLATSCERVEDMNFLLRYPRENSDWNDLLKELQGTSANAGLWNSSVKQRWESTFVSDGHFVGDYWTWDEFVNGRFGDFTYCYMDFLRRDSHFANYRHLFQYNPDEAQDPHPRYTDEASYEQWLTKEFYKANGNHDYKSDNNTLNTARFYYDSVRNADVISIAAGDANFGVVLLRNLVGCTGMEFGNFGFSDAFDFEGLMESRVDSRIYPYVKSALDSINGTLNGLVAGVPNGDKMLEAIEYTTASVMFNYYEFLTAIDDINDKNNLDIILVQFMNTLDGYSIDLGNGISIDLGKIIDVAMGALNSYIYLMPVYRQQNGEFEDFTFYIANTDEHIECIHSSMASETMVRDSNTVLRDRMITSFNDTILPILRGAGIDSAVASMGLGIVDTAHNINRADVERYEIFMNGGTYTDGTNSVTLVGYNNLFNNEGAYIGGVSDIKEFTSLLADGATKKNYFTCALYLAFEKAIMQNANASSINANSILSLLDEGGLASAFSSIATSLQAALGDDAQAAAATKIGNIANGIVYNYEQLAVISPLISAGLTFGSGKTYLNGVEVKGIASTCTSQDDFTSTEYALVMAAYFGQVFGPVETQGLIGSALADAVCDDEVIGGLLSLFARFIIGDGIGSHPSANGHKTLFDAIEKVYKKETAPETLAKLQHNMPAVIYETLVNEGPAAVEYACKVAETLGYLTPEQVAVINSQVAYLDEAIINEDYEAMKASAQVLATIIYGYLPEEVQAEITEVIEFYNEYKDITMEEIKAMAVAEFEALVEEYGPVAIASIRTYFGEKLHLSQEQLAYLDQKAAEGILALKEDPEGTMKAVLYRLADELFKLGLENGYYSLEDVEKAKLFVAQARTQYYWFTHTTEQQKKEYVLSLLLDLYYENEEALKAYATALGQSAHSYLYDLAVETGILDVQQQLAKAIAFIESHDQEYFEEEAAKYIASVKAEIAEKKALYEEYLYEVYLNATTYDYNPDVDSFYLALGGNTVFGTGLGRKDSTYYDQFAEFLGVDYDQEGREKLLPMNLISYVLGNAEAVQAADIITLELDSSAFIYNLLNEDEIDWARYLSSDVIAAIEEAFDIIQKAFAFDLTDLIFFDPDEFTAKLKYQLDTVLDKAYAQGVYVEEYLRGKIDEFVAKVVYQLDCAQAALEKAYNDYKVYVYETIQREVASATQAVTTNLFAFIDYTEAQIHDFVNRIIDQDQAYVQASFQYAAGVVYNYLVDLQNSIKAQLNQLYVDYDGASIELALTAFPLVQEYYDKFAEELAELDPYSKCAKAVEYVQSLLYAALPELLELGQDKVNEVLTYVAKNVEFCARKISASELYVINGVDWLNETVFAKMTCVFEHVDASQWSSYVANDKARAYAWLSENVLAEIQRDFDLAHLFIDEKTGELNDLLNEFVSTVLPYLERFENAKNEFYGKATGVYSDVLPYMDYIERTAYATLAYLVDTYRSVELIHSLNPEAELIVIGMYNPVRGLELEINGHTYSGEKIGNLVCEVANIYLFGLAAYTNDFSFVAVPETETVGANMTVVVDDLDYTGLVELISNIDKAMHANKNGHDYIYEQLVKAQYHWVTGVMLDSSSLDKSVEDVFTLTASVCPSNATRQEIIWTSSDPSIATVDENGTVTCLAVGTVTITATTFEGHFTDSCTVSITMPVKGVSLDKTSLTIIEGDTATLVATVTPFDATNQAITWSSSDTSVATVDANGLVTALVPGTTTITVTTTDGSFTATCDVEVVERIVTIPDLIKLVVDYAVKFGPEIIDAGKDYYVAHGIMDAQEYDEFASQLQAFIDASSEYSHEDSNAQFQVLVDWVEEFIKDKYYTEDVQKSIQEVYDFFMFHKDLTLDDLDALIAEQIEELVREYGPEALVAIDSYLVSKGFLSQAQLKELAHEIVDFIEIYKADPAGVQKALAKGLAALLVKQAIDAGYVELDDIVSKVQFYTEVKEVVTNFMSSPVEQQRAFILKNLYYVYQEYAVAIIDEAGYAELRVELDKLVDYLAHSTLESLENDAILYCKAFKEIAELYVELSTSSYYLLGEYDYYVALGGNTVFGTGVGRYDNTYFELLAQRFGMEYSDLGEEFLNGDNVLDYIIRNKEEIEKASFITYELDSSSFIFALLNEEDPDWSKLITPEQMAFIEQIWPTVVEVFNADWTAFLTKTDAELVDLVRNTVIDKATALFNETYASFKEECDAAIAAIISAVQDMVRPYAEFAQSVAKDAKDALEFIEAKLAEIQDKLLEHSFLELAQMGQDELVDLVKSYLPEFRAEFGAKAELFLAYVEEQVAAFHQSVFDFVEWLPNFFSDEQLEYYFETALPTVQKYIRQHHVELLSLTAEDYHDMVWDAIRPEFERLGATAYDELRKAVDALDDFIAEVLTSSYEWTCATVERIIELDDAFNARVLPVLENIISTDFDAFVESYLMADYNRIQEMVWNELMASCDFAKDSWNDLMDDCQAIMDCAYNYVIGYVARAQEMRGFALHLSEELNEFKPFAEKVAYSFVAYLVNTEKAIKLIKEFNPYAELFVIGMYNPVVGLTVSGEDFSFDAGKYADYLIDFTDLFYTYTACTTFDFTFVSVKDAETDGVNKVVDITDIDYVELARLISNIKDSMHANADGHAYIYSQIMNALPVRVSGVSLSDDELDMSIGEIYTVVATVEPLDAFLDGVYFYSDNDDVASVSDAGVIYANNAGEATIYAVTYDGEFTAEVYVTVRAIEVEDIELNKHSITLEVGASDTLVATVAPENASYPEVYFESDDERVAYVDYETGEVTGVGVGTTTIRVWASDFTHYDECEVTVVILPTSVSLDKNEIALVEGDSASLVATVSPADATNKDVTWSSSNTSVATVVNGVVTAVAPGTAIITVTTAEGGFTASATVTVSERIYPVTGVVLDKNFASLLLGENTTFTATVNPANASNKNVTWSTSDASVATVDNGKVSAVGVGTATITVTTADGGFKATATVIVSPIAVTSVTLDKTSANLGMGEKVTLSATVSPANATNKNISWLTSDSSVATVVDGVVTAVGYGTATITVITADGAKVATATIVVSPVSVTGVTLDKTISVLEIGQGVILTATVSPANATNKDIQWLTSDANVATVVDGKVTAVGLGTATITVITTDGAKVATCTVTVEEGVVHVKGVTLDKTSAKLVAGDELTLLATVTPNNADNKALVWSSSDTSVATVEGGKVRAISAGTALITVTTQDGGFTASCAVTVTGKQIHPSAVTLDKESLELEIGGVDCLVATVSPENAGVKDVVWSSSDTSVATVNANGVVTAVAAGTATITATTVDGSITASCTVTVVKNTAWIGWTIGAVAGAGVVAAAVIFLLKKKKSL